MSASRQTRDGSFSVASAILASGSAMVPCTPIDLHTALAWERNTGLTLTQVRHLVP